MAVTARSSPNMCRGMAALDSRRDTANSKDDSSRRQEEARKALKRRISRLSTRAPVTYSSTSSFVSREVALDEDD
jgi:hypothetical protein